jgi:Heterokaryon incompatibility protein (HET)
VSNDDIYRSSLASAISTEAQQLYSCQLRPSAVLSFDKMSPRASSKLTSRNIQGFKYKPLLDPETGIRLIEIMPGEENEPISCKICAYDSVAPSYHALSYAWGDSRQKMPIFLNRKPFLVTTSLEAALRSRRCRSFGESLEQLPLWVDAICIDQENGTERNHQVQRMKYVYANAETTIIWLGNYSEKTDAEVLEGDTMWDGVPLEEGSRETTQAALDIITCWAGYRDFSHSSGPNRDTIEEFFRNSPRDDL